MSAQGKSAGRLLEFKQKLKDAAKRSEMVSEIRGKFKRVLSQNMPQTDPMERSKCVFCEEPGENRCGSCKDAVYCSRECQVQDWKQGHMALCKAFADFTDEKRPSPSHVRAIFFPVGEVKARHVWVDQDVNTDGTLPLVEDFIGTYSSSISFTNINLIMGESCQQDLGHGLIMLSQTDGPEEKVLLNKSILSLGKPGHMQAWFGPHLVLSIKPDADPQQAPNMVLDDVDFRDYRHVIDMFQNWLWNPCVVNGARLRTDKVIPALMMHCDGSYVRYAGFGLQDRVEKVQVRLHSTIKQTEYEIEQESCLVAHQVGLDWFVRRYHSGRDWEMGHLNATTLRNELAARLVPSDMLSIVRRNAAIGLGWEEVGDRCQLPHTGTVLLVDRQGGQIEPAHVEALNDFLKSVDHFQPPKDEAIGGDHPLLFVGADVYGRDNAQKAFEKFWEEWKTQKKQEGINIDNVSSPYNLAGELEGHEMVVDTLMNTTYRQEKARDQVSFSIFLLPQAE
jgi:hypothetical protein